MKKDFLWKYNYLKNLKNTNAIICMFCDKTTKDFHFSDKTTSSFVMVYMIV